MKQRQKMKNKIKKIFSDKGHCLISMYLFVLTNPVILCILTNLLYFLFEN
jgi:hypothetical protein